MADGPDLTSLTLTADEIHGAKDTDAREFVACPEWGKVVSTNAEGKQVATPKGVFVRGLTLKERGVVRKRATEKVSDSDAPNGYRDVMDAEKLEALMVVHSACTADGRLIFKPTDFEMLLERLGGPINRIAKKAMELSGMLLTEKKLEG